MSEEQQPSGKVLIKRYPDTYTLIGPPIMVMDVDEAADTLAKNGWMRPWIAAKIREALMSGHQFDYVKRTYDDNAGTWKGRPDGVVAEWRLATQDEVLDYVDTASFASITGKNVSRHAQETAYYLRYHEGPRLIELYENLPRQAKIILDILNEAGRERFSEASIEVLLTENEDRLKTKQEPMKIFGFYRARLRDEGHLEEVSEEEVSEDE